MRTSGFVLRAKGEPAVYNAGNRVWCGKVRQALDAHRPGLAVVPKKPGQDENSVLSGLFFNNRFTAQPSLPSIK